MKALRRGLTICLFAVAAVVGPYASAWDTKEFAHDFEDEESGYENWRSLWLCDSSVSIGVTVNCWANEHERLADRALAQAISGTNPWAIRSPTELQVIDLNASWYRPDLVSGNEPYAYQRSPDSWAGPLEERDLANPPHFAGVADFTYTIYDWINKNRLCPPHPDGELEHCHNYSVWLGAGFNSSHFGTQASLAYQNLHQTALWAAGRARELREGLQNENEETQAAYGDYVREAELMALAYEAASQHFLSDRWSTGHMWERWNSPDFRSNPYNNDIGQSAVIGAFSGVIHGSEAVLGLPAMLSSPLPSVGLFGRNGVSPAEWRWANSEGTDYGVGDYRLNDMFDGFTGAEYATYANTDWPLNVTTQRVIMMQCLSGSFAQVIEAFGPNPDGGYGIDGVRTRAAARVNHNCLDPWATNWSIMRAWNVLNVSDTFTGTIVPYIVRTKLPGQARIDSSEVDTHTAATAGELILGRMNIDAALTEDRASLARISSRIFWNGTFRGDGTELARGGMGPFGRAQSGTYGAPDYLEPRDLSTLPEEDPRGRDAQTVHGFFNRAFATEFCESSDQRFFEELRARIRSTSTSDEDRDRLRGVCRYLAQRMFIGTYASYEGGQRSYPVARDTVQGATNPPELGPVCGWAYSMVERPEDDALPQTIHPGYVEDGFSQTNSSSWTDTYGGWGYAQESIANWCDSTPVVDTIEADDPQLDVVAVVSDRDARIELYGANFGAGRGRVLLGQDVSSAVEVSEIVRWYDDRITFTLGDQFDDVTFDSNDLVRVIIERESEDANLPGFRSVGRFRLLNEIPRPEIVSVRVSGQDGDFYTFHEEEQVQIDGALGEDDGPPPELSRLDEAFRPIGPGEVRIELEFNMAIDPEVEGTSITIAGQEIEGQWRARGTRWRGEFTVPEGDEFRSQFAGAKPIVINVQARDGGWIDGDTDNPGPQPDQNHILLFDTIPMIATRVRVQARGNLVYDAEWAGGADLDRLNNLSYEAVDAAGATRSLQVRTARAVPAEGRGRIRVEFSSAPSDAPTIRIGNATVENMSSAQEGLEWRGEFDLAAATAGEVDGEIPVNITATDQAGKGLDADPRSITYMHPMTNRNARWGDYDSARGGAPSNAGGADVWHNLGEPPELSIVLILDASGSMGDNNRMANAHAGVQSTLDELAATGTAEAAGVIFYNCNSIYTHPFTRNLDSVRDFLLRATPTNSTDLAGGIDTGHDLLSADANPGSPLWRYITLTDGVETCDGNVARATQRIERLVSEHGRLVQGNSPRDDDDAPPLEPEDPPQVVCHQGNWNAYQVEVEGNGGGFDTIALVEVSYSERSMADGSCRARLVRELRYVHYGSIRDRRNGPSRSHWDINSNVSDRTLEVGWSRISEDDVTRVRNLARQTRGQSVALDAARSQIDEAVTAALQEQEDS